MDKFPQDDECNLTNKRACYIKNETLGMQSKRLALDSKLLYSRFTFNIQKNEKVYGDIFESLMGAIFVDLGLEPQFMCNTETCTLDLAGNFLHKQLLNQNVDL